LNKQEFTHLLKNYNDLSSEHIAMLKDIVKEYSYFSSANVLLAKAMSNDKHYEYEKQLKATALITGDRSVLYKIINNIPLQSIDEPHIIAEIPTALRVEKISKPDFVGVEEDLKTFEEPTIVSNSLHIEEEIIPKILQEHDFPIEKIVEAQAPIVKEIKDEIAFPIAEISSENIEANVESDSTHLTKWSSIEHPFEKEHQEELNDVEKAFDEELRNEARSFIEESKQTETLSELYDTIELVPEDSLAEATGNMLRFENIREEDSLINLDDDDMLIDFDFGSIDGENVNQSLSQSVVLPVSNETENFEAHAEIPDAIEKIDEFFSNEPNITFESPDPMVLKKEEIDNSISDLTSDETPADMHDVDQKDESSEIDALPDPFANTKEEIVESDKPENYAPSLENLLDFEEEVEINEAHIDEPLSNWAEENMANFQQLFDEPEVSAIQKEIASDTVEVEPIAESEIENHIDENEIIVEDPLNSISLEQVENHEEHGFMDWLVAKKDSDISSESHIDSAEKINDFTKEEDDEFTLTIRQLIKERAEKSSNIANELTQNIEEEVELENIVSNEYIEETIVESIPDFSKNETQEENTIVEEKTKEAHPFYDYKVESVLPDFEQMVFHDLSDEETNENASELNIKPSFEEKLITDEVKLVFHPIHGLVPAGFDDDATEIIIEKKQEPISEEPIIEPWTEFNESLIVPTEAPEIASTTFIHEEELLGKIGEIQIDSIEDSSDEEEEEYEIPVFDEVSFSDTDFDKGFSSQFVPLTKLEEPIEVIDSEPVISEVLAVKTLENINVEPKVVLKDEKVESIIDKFIRENPNISRPKAEFYNPSNMAKWSAEEDDDLVSETLANVYLGQGLIKKAISTYEKLGLIYPHKMSYFAALINQLKTTHKIE
jgi:hypothetical protein